MDPFAGDVTRVELGPRRGGRRWWPFVVAAMAAWVAVALAVGAGGGDDEAPASVGSTTTTSRPGSTSSRPPRASTSTTATTIVPGAPLAGRPTGWRVLAVSGTPGRSRALDLDSGVIERGPELESVIVGNGGIYADDGVTLRWLADPLDPSSAVELPVHGHPLPVVGTDLAWIVVVDREQERGPEEARLVRASDGAELRRESLPSGQWPLGVAAGRLVVGGGGDTFVLGTDGSIDRLPGQPLAADGDHVYLSVCTDDLQCHVEVRNLRTGESATIDGLVAAYWNMGPLRPGGGFLSAQYDGSREHWSLVLPTGLRPVVPLELEGQSLWNAAWSPDGSLLFIGAPGELLVVDPFAEGGPRLVATVPFPSAYEAQLVVYGSAP